MYICIFKFPYVVVVTMHLDIERELEQRQKNDHLVIKKLNFYFGKDYFCQLILLFSLFLLLFMSPLTFFGIIHESYYTISTHFYIYLQYFQQKIFNFSKINEFQTDTQAQFGSMLRFAAFKFPAFSLFFCFFFARLFPLQAATVHVLYINSSRNF